MFEKLADAGVVDAMASAAREEAAGCARRLAAIGEFYARRAPEDDTDRQNWAIDGHANVVAEVSAALNISRGRAVGQLSRCPVGARAVLRPQAVCCCAEFCTLIVWAVAFDPPPLRELR